MTNIIEKALLVKLSIFQFNPKRNDDKVTKEVLAEKKAKNEAGVWIKNLVNPKTLADINKKAMQARLENYDLSLSWNEEGYRILPVTMYEKYQSIMRERKKEFEIEVEKFLSKYELYKSEAKKALNGMYNEKEYPSIEELKRKFDFVVDFTPLPCGNDFRISLANDELESLQKDVENRVKEATKQAMKDLWLRLAEPIKHLAEKLNDKDAIFRDSIIENIKDIIELIEPLNVMNDVNLTAIAKECKKELLVNPDTLRANESTRELIAQKADAILKKMEGYC